MYPYNPHECVPVNGPSDYIPWWSGSREMAERLKHTLEQEYRNRYNFELMVEGDKARVVFTFPPSYLYNFEIRRSPDAPAQ